MPKTPRSRAERTTLRQAIDALRTVKNDGPTAAYANLYEELYRHYGKAGVLQQVDQYCVRYQRKGDRADLVKAALWLELLDELEGGRDVQS